MYQKRSARRTLSGHAPSSSRLGVGRIKDLPTRDTLYRSLNIAVWPQVRDLSIASSTGWRQALRPREACNLSGRACSGLQPEHRQNSGSADAGSADSARLHVSSLSRAVVDSAVLPGARQQLSRTKQGPAPSRTTGIRRGHDKPLGPANITPMQCANATH